MPSCPLCRLLLESTDWHGATVFACRSCGGTWFDADNIPFALGVRRADLDELNTLYPGLGAAAAFSGLGAPCPRCGTELVLQRLTQAGEEAGRVCPQCGGIWLEPDLRARLASLASPATGEAVSSALAASDRGLTIPQPDAAVLTDPSSADIGEDPVLAANAEYSRNFRYGHMAREPRRKVAVLTCMDARMRLYEMLGMEAGDLNVIRNAGGIVTEDSLRSLMISHHFLGTREFFVINHTDCGLLNFDERSFRARLVRETGASSAIPATFHPILDLEENVREQIRRLRSHPWIPASVGIRGFVYDVRTGRLNQVTGS